MCQQRFDIFLRGVGLPRFQTFIDVELSILNWRGFQKKSGFQSELVLKTLREALE